MIVANALQEGDVVTVRFNDSGTITNVRLASVFPYFEFFYGGRLYTLGLDAQVYDLDF